LPSVEKRWYGMFPKNTFRAGLTHQTEREAGKRGVRRKNVTRRHLMRDQKRVLCQQHLGASRIDRTGPILHQFDDGKDEASTDAEKERGVPGMR